MSEMTRLSRSITGPFGLSVTDGQIYTFPVHTHAYYELTCYSAAPGLVSVNGQEISLQQPCIILITPSDFHRIQTDGVSCGEYIKIQFDESVLSPAARSSLNFPMVLHDGPDFALPRQIFEEMLAHRTETDYTVQLLSLLVMMIGKRGEMLFQSSQQRCNELALQATRILNEQFTGPITLSGLADALSVSPQYLSQIFSRAMGVTFQDYLSALRLRLAAEWLRESSRSVTDICFGCGYRNLSHFLRSFKKRYGLSPRQYRQQGRHE